MRWSLILGGALTGLALAASILFLRSTNSTAPRTVHRRLSHVAYPSETSARVPSPS